MGQIKGKKRKLEQNDHIREKKRKREDDDVAKLEESVQSLEFKNSYYKEFSELPLSKFTQDGLKGAHFTTLTDIQTRAIPIALQGADILGAAKTGSGKTLAFIIPVLENLYRKQFVGKEAGLGAMIISPTRELAIQIFEVLHKIGCKGHTFAAGLIIGGKSLQEEQQALVRMNIVVCTPGRMLQHLSQTASFDTDGLQILVLDEADRILDMGFQREVDAILDYLPANRQTMLFSATQTKRVSDLARLSLKNPEYISVHEEASNSTPKGLTQNYVLTPLPEKLDTLWSFIQSAKKSKILVFLSSGKQVRFVYESFRHLQPGIPLLHLHGRQKQTTRLQITKRFTSAQTSCLFATDVVARGLDFPAVDWVVQVDCPEDAQTYIHRVGRTARYGKEGKAILFLDPTEEEGMLKRLESKKVPIEKVNVKGRKKMSVKNALQNMCFKDAQLKYLGQKAFTSYVRSIYIQHDREIFQVDKLPLEEYAASLGLPGAPRIKFLAGDDAKSRKNAPRAPLNKVAHLDDDTEEDDDSDISQTENQKKAKASKTKYDRMFERQNQDILATHYHKLVDQSTTGFENSDVSDESEDDNEHIQGDDFLSVKQRIPVDPDEEGNERRRYVNIDGVSTGPILVDSKRAEKRLHSKKALLKLKDKGSRIVFDEDGEARPAYEVEDERKFHARGAAEEQRIKFLDEERDKVAVADMEDKEIAKARRKEKKEKRKAWERSQRGIEDGGYESEDDKEGGVVLGTDTGDRDLVKEFLEDTKDLNSEEDNVEEQTPRTNDKKRHGKDNISNKSRKNKNQSIGSGIETFEDLENLAAGLLED